MREGQQSKTKEKEKERKRKVPEGKHNNGTWRRSKRTKEEN
jgi:hypothetical protein